MASPDEYAAWIVQNQDKQGTPEFETVSRAYQQLRGAAPAPKVPLLNTGALADTIKDLPRHGVNALDSAFTGAVDFGIGAGQLVSKAVPGDHSKRYDDAMRWRESRYQEGRGEHADLLDIGRFSGGLIVGGVAGMGKQAATLAGRAAQGARVGFAEGVASPVDPDAGDYAISKTLQSVGGAAIGALAAPAVEGVIRGVGSAINFLGNSVRGVGNTLAGRTNPANIQQTLSMEFQQQGVDWSGLPQQFRDDLTAQVQSALKAGGQLDTEAIRRLADFHRLGMEPTQGQVSRNPLQFAREQNYAKLEPGQPLAERFGQHNRQLIGNLDQARGRTGASSTDPYSSGQNAIRDLRGVDKTNRDAIDAEYDMARDHLGRAAPVDHVQFSTEANLALDEGMLGHYLPTEVRNILNDITAGKIPLNVNTLVQIDSVLSGAQRTAGDRTPQALAIGKVRDALNRAQISDNVGEDARAQFSRASGMARDRFRTLEQTPGMDDAAGTRGTDAEKFLERYVLRGGVDDVTNLMRQMTPQGRSEAMASVVDFLRSKAVSGTEDTAKFSQAGLANAIKTIGDRKLSLIFADNTELLSRIRTMARVGGYVQSPPISSGVNYSSSATTGADFLDQFSRLPLMSLIGKPGDILRSVQVSSALNNVAPTQAAEGLLSSRLINQGGLLGGGLAGAGSGLLVPGAIERPHQDRSRQRAISPR